MNDVGALRLELTDTDNDGLSSWRKSHDKQGDASRPKPLRFEWARRPQSLNEGLKQISTGVPTDAKRLLRLARIEALEKILKAADKLTDIPAYQAVHLMTAEATIYNWARELKKTTVDSEIIGPHNVRG